VLRAPGLRGSITYSREQNLIDEVNQTVHPMNGFPQGWLQAQAILPTTWHFICR
jgi:hypothetical protein